MMSSVSENQFTIRASARTMRYFVLILFFVLPSLAGASDSHRLILPVKIFHVANNLKPAIVSAKKKYAGYILKHRITSKIATYHLGEWQLRISDLDSKIVKKEMAHQPIPKQGWSLEFFQPHDKNSNKTYRFNPRLKNLSSNTVGIVEQKTFVLKPTRDGNWVAQIGSGKSKKQPRVATRP